MFIINLGKIQMIKGSSVRILIVVGLISLLMGCNQLSGTSGAFSGGKIVGSECRLYAEEAIEGQDDRVLLSQFSNNQDVWITNLDGTFTYSNIWVESEDLYGVVTCSGGTYINSATGLSEPGSELNVSIEYPEGTPDSRGEFHYNDITDLSMMASPLSEIAYQLSYADNDLSDIKLYNNYVADYFGLDDLNASKFSSVIPTDLNEGAATIDDAGLVGLTLAGLSQLKKSGVTVTDLINDLADGDMNAPENDFLLALSSLQSSAVAAAGNVASSYEAKQKLSMNQGVFLRFQLVVDEGRNAFDGVSKNGVVVVSNLGEGVAWYYSVNAGNSFSQGSGKHFILAEGIYNIGDIQVKQAYNPLAGLGLGGVDEQQVSNEAMIIIDGNEGDINRVTSVAYSGQDVYSDFLDVDSLWTDENGYGGFSGLDYELVTDTWSIITDSKKKSQIIQTEMAVDNNGLHTDRLDGSEAAINLQHIGGIDAEAVRVWNNEGTITYFIASEGVQGSSIPRILEVDGEGNILAEFTIPAAYSYTVNPNSGARSNGSFEGLTLSPDGQRLYAAIEHPLLQDGSKATASAGGLNTILEFDRVSHELVKAHKYLSDPIFLSEDQATGFSSFFPYSMLGVSEILTVDNNTLLILERVIARASGFGARVYQVDLPDRTEAETATPLVKEQLIDLQQAWSGSAGNGEVITFNGTVIDNSFLFNLEGMSWGKAVVGGGRPLLLTADNDFKYGLNQMFQFNLSGH